MVDPKIIEDLTRRLASMVPEGARTLQQDLEKNFRASLSSAFSRLDLVTREELEVQQAVLAKTREKIEHLEARVRELEALLREQDTPQAR
jgi:ubiquinone biosynthesis accessory factor UbiK